MRVDFVLSPSLGGEFLIGGFESHYD